MFSGGKGNRSNLYKIFGVKERYDDILNDTGQYQFHFIGTNRTDKDYTILSVRIYGAEMYQIIREAMSQGRYVEKPFKH